VPESVVEADVLGAADWTIRLRAGELWNRVVDRTEELRARFEGVLKVGLGGSAGSVRATLAEIERAQAAVSALTVALLSPSPEIIALENKATELMSEITRSLHDLLANLARQTEYEPMDPLPMIGKRTVSVDAVSETQVRRVLGLIRELEERFPQQLECQSAVSEQLKDMLSVLERRPSQPDAQDADTIDPSAQYADLTAAVISHQKEALAALRSAFEDLPDALRQTAVDDLPPPKEADPIRLPVLKHKPSPVSDAYLESTIHLLNTLGKGPRSETPVRIEVPQRSVPPPTSALPSLTASLSAELEKRASLDNVRAGLLSRLSAAKSKLAGFANIRRKSTAERKREISEARKELERINKEIEEKSARLKKFEGDEPRWRNSIAECERRNAALEGQIALMHTRQERLARVRTELVQVDGENDDLDYRIRERDDAARYDDMGL
jgi:predicted  nucleic acid-binding Zn-ribbon protein